MLRPYKEISMSRAALQSGSVEVVHFRQGPQSRSGAFRSDVPLRPREQFIADYELLHGGGPQKWRKVMRVEVPLGVFLFFRRLLVKTHRIRERSLEEVVVANGQTQKDVREMAALFFV